MVWTNSAKRMEFSQTSQERSLKIELLPLDVHMSVRSRLRPIQIPRPEDIVEAGVMHTDELLELPDLEVSKIDKPAKKRVDGCVPPWLIVTSPRPSILRMQPVIRSDLTLESFVCVHIQAPVVVNELPKDNTPKAHAKQMDPPGEPPLSALSSKIKKRRAEFRLYNRPIDDHSYHLGYHYLWKPTCWMGDKLKAETEQGDPIVVQFLPATEDVTFRVDEFLNRMDPVETIGDVLGYDLLPQSVVDRSLCLLRERRKLPMTDFVCCMYTTYLPGVNIILSQLMTDAMREVSLIHFLRQILRTLVDVHSQGITHGRVFARHMHVVEGPVMLREPEIFPRMIEPVYMSPEGVTSMASDVWHLGLLCVELHSGQQPRWRSELSDLLSLKLEIAVSPGTPVMPGFSSEGLDFVCKCLTKDVIQRPTSSELLSHPWLA